jgi:N-acetylmuramoyl-L-alanine amidase
VARWPEAIWQPGAPCSGTLNPRTVTLHHQAGNGNPYNVYISRRVSAHFWIPKTGQPYQHVDTNVQAWHGVAHNSVGLGIETEGCGSPPHADPLTEHQLNQFAALMAWAHHTHGIPLRLSESVTEPGLNYHRCAGGPATGCPCDVRKNARAEILRRAGATAPAPPTPPAPTAPSRWEDKNMILQDPKTGGVWVVADRAGAVWTYDGAPFLGGTNNPKMNAGNYPCVGIAAYRDASGDGYQLVLDWGDAGGGKSQDGGDRFRRYRFPRSGAGRV